MARKPLHTQEEVFAVADRLAGEGKEVTPSTLLRELGGGSLTTLYKHHEAWLEKRKAQAVPVPIEMPEAAHAAFRTLWSALTAEASKEIALIREKADADVKAAERRFAEALESIASLESESEAESARADALAEQIAQAGHAAQDAATAAASREAGLMAVADELRHQIEGFQQTLREHAQREADLVAANTTLREQIASLQGDLRNAHENAGALRAQVERANASVDQIREEVERRQAAHVETVADLTKQAQEAATASAAREAALTATVDELRQQLKEQKMRSAEAVLRLEESKTRLEAEFGATARELRDNASALGKALGEVEVLREQVASLSGIISAFKKV